jgi:hypothetical protein
MPERMPLKLVQLLAQKMVPFHRYSTPSPYAMHHTYTIHHHHHTPSPYAVHYALTHYAPYTTLCTHTPYTIHHTPHTIHHTPYTIHYQS